MGQWGNEVNDSLTYCTQLRDPDITTSCNVGLQPPAGFPRARASSVFSSIWYIRMQTAFMQTLRCKAVRRR